MITSIYIPENSDLKTFSDGLGQPYMDRLGRVVVLAGKNGSGKSRLLHRIEVLHNSNKNEAIKRNFIKIDTAIDDFIVKSFVPLPQNQFESTKSIGLDQIRLRAQKVSELGVDGLHHSTLPYIQNLYDSWVKATNPRSSMENEERNRIITKYEAFEALIKNVLGFELDEWNDELSFNKMPMNQAGLSNGQSILLQLCVALFEQEQKLENIILLLDEPENHIHPSVIVDVINTLLYKCKVGQLWIATHSIPLISYFDPDTIWYMEDGKIAHAGRMPERVLEGLIGDEERISKLKEFTSLPSQFATARFAVECLKDAISVITPNGDPQTKQIGEVIAEFKSQGRKVKILDFGAGKGRLLNSLLEEYSAKELSDWLDYTAYDPMSTREDILQAETLISKVHSTEMQRYLDTEGRLVEAVGAGDKFDIIVLCNTLHEIEPQYWESLFKLIEQCLAPEGQLLIVEDEVMPHGEKAYKNGFLVLDKGGVEVLFNSADFITKYERGRLACHRLAKNVIKNISPESIIGAVRYMLSTSSQKISLLRESDFTYKKGLEHGFWVQQLANAHLILKSLED